MKARILLDALTAAATAGAATVADKLTGRDPARRARPTSSDALRLADRLIDQQRRGQRP